ncbi:gamma-glutamylcyclotransferase [Candidatus Woesearchaeota archaeon]|nr:gamma-glutamylcyclotransferase [Candidatus Woesearchaeota archaeon]
MANIIIPKKHFVFGYGSLINKQSAMKTGDVGRGEFGEAVGLKRSWNTSYRPFKGDVAKDNPANYITGVGALPSDNAVCNGVLLEIPESEFASFAERENEYKLSDLKPGDIRLYNAVTPDGHMHFYEILNPRDASEKFPLAQSYIDVIIAGCLKYDAEHGTGFAEDFIRKTAGWEKGPWVNDRANPRYIRPLEDTTDDIYRRIDKVLSQTIPEHFARRR